MRNLGIAAAVLLAYPDHSWEVWKFTKIPSGWWDDINFQRFFLDKFAESRNMTSMDSWYSVLNKEMVEAGGMFKTTANI